MNISIYSIRDIKVNAFRPPFTARNAAEAQRILSGALTQKNQLSEYPQDFDLYYIGELNDTSGQLDGVKPELICSLLSLHQALSASAPARLAPQSALSEQENKNDL